MSDNWIVESVIGRETSSLKKLSLIVLACLLLQFCASCPVYSQTNADHARARIKMVDLYVKGAGVTNDRVLQAMRDVPRHEFMPKETQKNAYLDAGIAIGEKQTISSPFIVAYMTESLDPQETDKVLEIGTGSGYQAAVLSPLAKSVYTIEIVEILGRRAKKTLKRLNYDNVHVKIGDGFAGWPENAPFDKIIVTCSPENIPDPLVEQLREGGLIVVPMGERHQQTLYLMRKKDGKMVKEALRPTLFVPMTGTAESNRKVMPDPTKPALLNPSFEEEPDKNGFMPGWYYQRQLEHEKELLAPHGEHFVTFDNDLPGRAAHLMQGFAIDGRQVKKIVLSASIKCDNVRPGAHPADLPIVNVTFYDEDRQELDWAYMGPFQGTRSWQNEDKDIEVPTGAREAIVRIGLFGAVGSASFDNIKIRRDD